MSAPVMLLYVAAIVQIGVAVLALFLTPLLGWRDDVARMPLLMREVFYVHSWFVSLTLVIFAVLTMRFAAEMVDGPGGLARWLAAAIGLFWGFRTVLQVFYYSSSHWRGKPGPTAVHIALLLLYGSLSLLYLVAVTRGDAP